MRLSFISVDFSRGIFNLTGVHSEIHTQYFDPIDFWFSEDRVLLKTYTTLHSIKLHVYKIDPKLMTIGEYRSMNVPKNAQFFNFLNGYIIFARLSERHERNAVKTENFVMISEEDQFVEIENSSATLPSRSSFESGNSETVSESLNEKLHSPFSSFGIHTDNGMAANYSYFTIWYIM
jgi:hypothetical protein